MGSTVEIETSGEREQEAMDALLALIADKFERVNRMTPTLVTSCTALPPGGLALLGRPGAAAVMTFSIHGLAVAAASHRARCVGGIQPGGRGALFH